MGISLGCNVARAISRHDGGSVGRENPYRERLCRRRRNQSHHGIWEAHGWKNNCCRWEAAKHDWRPSADLSVVTFERPRRLSTLSSAMMLVSSSLLVATMNQKTSMSLVQRFAAEALKRDAYSNALFLDVQ